MSSPCPVPRILRCRVRDIASCFYACRLPLEEDRPNQISCSKPPDMSSGSIVYDFTSSRKKSTAKKIGGESSVKNSSTSSSNFNRGKMSRLEAEPHFEEDDYIVFCFREDGAIDMISNEGRSSEEKDEHDVIATDAVSVRKSEEKRSKKTETERHQADDEIKENIKPVGDEQPNESKVDSSESSDSNISDTTSTSSFAFPVMGIEWIGSPVHMPRSGSGNQSVRLHCCRF